MKIALRMFLGKFHKTGNRHHKFRRHQFGSLVTIIVLLIVTGIPAMGAVCPCICCDEMDANGHHPSISAQPVHDNRCKHCSWDPSDQNEDQKIPPSLVSQTIDNPVRLAKTTVFSDTAIISCKVWFTEPGKVVRSAPPLFLQTLSIRR